MISIIQTTKHSVIRLSMYDPKTKTYTGERLIGTYESLNEASFIAKKAEKMEKAAVFSSRLKQQPGLASKFKIQDVVLADILYKIVPAVDNKLSALYTNGVSNIVHHMKELNPHEKRLDKEEQNSNSYLSFEEFINLRESNVLLRSKLSKNWTPQDLGITYEETE